MRLSCEARSRAKRQQRRRAECLANIQTEITKYTLDLLVRVPDLDALLPALLKTLAEEGESHAAGVWLIDEDKQCCDFWMAHLFGEVVHRRRTLGPTLLPAPGDGAVTCFDYKAGWEQTIEYRSDDPRLPQLVREFNSEHGLYSTARRAAACWAARISDGSRSACAEDARGRLVVAHRAGRGDRAAGGAGAAQEPASSSRSALEERRKAILEERNRLARDIHDNLAQGFGAILMQLQAAQREGHPLPAAGRAQHRHRRRSRAHAHGRSAAIGRRTASERRATARTSRKRSARWRSWRRRRPTSRSTSSVDELPRFGDGVEREVIGIAQEALTNAVRHARASASPIRASTVQLDRPAAVGRRRRPRHSAGAIVVGFGMTSMQERADRIGASLTIVTAPRSGTEVVLAWEPVVICRRRFMPLN